MRAFVDVVSSALGAQMSLIALVLYEAWPRFVDALFDFETAKALTNAQFWSLVVVIGIGVGAVWRWHRRELAMQIGGTTMVLLVAFSYLQAWISLDRGVGLDELGGVIDDQWLWLWVVIAPAAAGAWWVRRLTNARSR
jgi:hypothetical protein